MIDELHRAALPRGEARALLVLDVAKHSTAIRTVRTDTSDIAARLDYAEALVADWERRYWSKP